METPAGTSRYDAFDFNSDDDPFSQIDASHEPKERITVRFDKDVLRYFRSFGPGYQTRMNAVLRAWMLAHEE